MRLLLLLSLATGAWTIIVLGIVMGACGGTDPDPRTLSPGAARAAQSSPRLEKQHKEQIVPGRALVELQPGMLFPQPVEPAASADPGGGGAAALPTWGLGGGSVKVMRPLLPDKDGKGAILLVMLDMSDLPRGAGAAEGVALTRQWLSRIAADPRVRRVEPDRLRYAFAMPNDAHYGEQWSLPQVNLPRAWDRTTGSKDVIVAVMDTGIVHNHPDLEARLVPGYDFISDPVSAGDGNGRDPDPSDPGTIDGASSGLHGTHVSGIIGAVSDNQIGITGVDWNCRLLPVRVLGIDGGTGVDSDIADAILWSIGRQVGSIPPVSRPAQVINMSFGGLGISFTLQRAVDEAINSGTIVVAAAGNLGDRAANFSPGGLDGVITVGSSGKDMMRADYSNYGPRVDLLAPGGNGTDLSQCSPDGILSTYRDIGARESPTAFTYCTLEGTSQAAPHVSGAAALVRSLAPVRQLTLASLLRSSADHGKSCDATEFGGCGAGLLNVDALLLLASLQPQCNCTGDQLCLDGRCIDPGYPHVSIFADPVVHGGCALSPGHDGQGASGALGALAGLLLLLLLRSSGSRSSTGARP